MKSVAAGSEGAGARSASYLQIVKSTALIGGSSMVNIVFAVIRNKAVALLLGPEGVGLMGLYNSIADLAQTLAGLGVQASGVRQVAEAAGTNQAERIAKTGIVLNRVSLVLGVLGMVLLAVFALPVAEFTFENREHAAGVVLLSVAVLLRIISIGQVALIQGLRHIADLARITMWGAFWSTLVCLPIIFVWRQDGVVPAIVAMSVTTLAVSWYYSRRVKILSVHVTARETRRETAALLKLGVAFMASGFLTVAAAYAIRIIVLRLDGIEAAGLYQAAWSIGGIYAGFILQAMGADFYPRLTAVHNDNEACNRLVNEQTQISILLAGPGLIATLTVAPLLMTVLYSSEFHAAVDLLRWICLGMMLRIVAWPIGYIVLAKGAKWIFLFTEIAATLVHVGLAWFLVGRFGLVGAGVAFFGLYVWHGVLIYWISRRLSGFHWSSANLALAVAYMLAAALVLSAFYVLPPWQATAVGTLVVIVACLSSLRMLLKLLPRDKLPLGRWLPQWI